VQLSVSKLEIPSTMLRRRIITKVEWGTLLRTMTLLHQEVGSYGYWSHGIRCFMPQSNTGYQIFGFKIRVSLFGNREDGEAEFPVIETEYLR